MSRETAERLSAMSGTLGYVVLEGQVVGTWKRELKKDEVVIKTNLSRRLSKAEERAVRIASRAYADFLAKNPNLSVEYSG